MVLHDNALDGELPQNGTTTHWVGLARYDIFPAYSSWRRVSVPFTYYNNGMPDYALIVISPGDNTIALGDTEMWVDDLEMIYNPNLISVSPASPQNINIGTNGSDLIITDLPNAGVGVATLDETLS